MSDGKDDDRGRVPDHIWQMYEHLDERLSSLHTEQKAQRVINADYLVRLQKLEFLDEQKEERLREGAQTMATIRESLYTPWWKVLAWAFPPMLVVGGWLWWLAKMPSAERFDSMENKVHDLEIRQTDMAGDIRVIRNAVEKPAPGPIP